MQETKSLINENINCYNPYFNLDKSIDSYSYLIIKRNKYFRNQYFDIFLGLNSRYKLFRVVAKKGKYFNIFKKKKKILWAKKINNKWIIHKLDYPGMELLCVKLEEDPNYDFIKTMTIISRKNAFIDQAPIISKYFENICNYPSLYSDYRVNFNKKPIFNSNIKQYFLNIGLTNCIASEKTMILQDKSLIIGRQENNFFKLKFKKPWNILEALSITLSRLVD